jgi:hypothetical protein
MLWCYERVTVMALGGNVMVLGSNGHGVRE